MENLVIFSNPLVTALMLASVILFMLCPILRRTLGDTDKTKRITEILSLAAIACSIALVAVFFVIRITAKDGKGVTPDEIFFVFAVISAVALTTSGAGRKEN